MADQPRGFWSSFPGILTGFTAVITAIDQRGMAHCKAPDNLEIRQALLDTLTLCRAADIEWQDIQHSTILGKE